MDADPETTAATIALVAWAIRDTLQAARSHAARAQHPFSGTPEFALLWNVEVAIANLIDGPELRALRSAGIPPAIKGS